MSFCEDEKESKMMESGYQTPQKRRNMKNDHVQETAADSYEKEGLSMEHD